MYLCVYIRFKQQEMNLYIGTLQAQESPEPTIDLSKCELEEVWLMIEFDYMYR